METLLRFPVSAGVTKILQMSMENLQGFLSSPFPV
jgi:hypothetical protein